MVRALVVSMFCVAAVAITVRAQQPPPLGIAAVNVGPGPYVFDTAEQHKIRVVVVASGLPHPFSLTFLPNGDALVTERGGRLRLVRGATGASPRLEPEPIGGTPQQPAFRTGGLQEIALHPQFAANRFVYFTYNKAGEPVAGGQPGQRQSAITLARGKLEGTMLTGVQELFMGDWQNGASGSRLAFAPGNLLYVTTGAPFGEQAQDRNSVYGKVLRLTDEGKVPADNPFVGTAGTRPEIYLARTSRSARTGGAPGAGVHRRAWAERRRRDQPGQTRAQLRMAAHQLRARLPGSADFGVAGGAGHRAAPGAVDPLDRADRHGVLHRRQRRDPRPGGTICSSAARAAVKSRALAAWSASSSTTSSRSSGAKAC